MLDMHLRRSQTGYPSVVSSLLGIGRNHRERGLKNTVGAAAAASNLIEKVNRCCYCVRTGIVMKKKKATKSRLWTALAPNFEDFRVTEMHRPVRNDRPSVIERNGGDMARFSAEAGNHL